MQSELRIVFWAITISLLTALTLVADGTENASGHATPEFARDVLPILSDHCFSCHGPDEASRQAGLRLDIRERALTTNDGVSAIVPGEPDSSEMIRRVFAGNGDVMPPPEALKRLTNVEKDVLLRWVSGGAPYERHWAFRAPRQSDPPAVRQTTWPRNAVDRFVLKKLESAGLKPASAVPRHTWLRRVTLDLTGLPPTIEELDTFLSDRSPDAERNVVDRLLTSEAHAERMTMHWLDSARYADTNGYNNDEIRTMWPWRDWVISAFHSGMTYDQFLTEQIAGDLLPNPTIAQRVATGFNRNHVLTTEGGIILEEYQAEYVADRVHTVATTFMGISLQCARCHDHKFDPFTQRDFYRFAAYFNNIPDTLVRYDTVRMADPVLKVPSPAQQQELDELNARKQKLAAELQTLTESIDSRVAAWEAGLTPKAVAELSSPELIAWFRFDEKHGNATEDSVETDRSGLIHGPISREKGVAGLALKFGGSAWVDAGQIGVFDSDDQFSLAAWCRPTRSGGAILSKMDDANGFRGYDLVCINGKLECHVAHHWPDRAIRVVTKQPVSLNEWHHVVATYDGSRQATGLQLFVDGRRQELDVTADSRLDGPLTTDKPFHIGKRSTSIPFHGLIDDVQVFAVRLSAAEVLQLAKGRAPERLSAILAVRPAERSQPQREQLNRFYVDRIDADLRKTRDELQTTHGRVAAVNQAIPVTMIMQEMEERRPTHILIRGQYDRIGSEVGPGLPASLAGDAVRAGRTRLDLARWLTDPAHPLTARVAVNRWWEMLFGMGLVETVEDFGVQGARPSHPELLDWLAMELIRQKWNQRAILKLMVLSSTYRQSSDVAPQQLEVDPQNRLLSRAPRWRLPAEVIRDNALAISGLLHRQAGGPSVRPYQPAGLWEDVSVERRDRYVADTGPGLYRRSMYTFWKRTCPPPAMLVFDAPDRETCVIRRARTNTPLQALVLLNDPTYVEAARAFAERIMHHHADDTDRLNFAWRCAAARLPRDLEYAVASDLLTAARQRFHARPDAAKKLLSVGDSKMDASLEAAELAAWTSLASILLNLDETISKP